MKKRPYINEVNRKRRLQLAREHIERDESWWERILFADESKFNIFGWNGIIKCRTSIKEPIANSAALWRSCHGLGAYDCKWTRCTCLHRKKDELSNVS